MNENDINDLLNSALGGNTARKDFKERLLQNSTAAFTRGRTFHNRFKMIALILLITAITTAAFFTGRFSAIDKTSNQQQIAWQTNPDDNNISVSRDLVAWLDAAKFFTQLGMSERAEFSYKQASQLIPVDTMQDNVADIGQNIKLAKLLNDFDNENLKITHQEQKEFPEMITNKILAHNFGD